MDMMHTGAVAVSKADWDAVVSDFPGYNYEQSSTYAEAAAHAIGGRAEYLIVKAPAACIGGASVRIKALPGFKCGIAYITGGILVSSAPDAALADRHRVILDAIAAYLRQHKHCAILREPISSGMESAIETNYLGAGFQKTQYARRYRTILIDVAQDQDALKKGFAAKWRRDLNSSLKSDLHLEQGFSRALQDRFMRVYDTMVDNKKLELALSPTKFFELDAEKLGLHILIATKDGQDAAVHLLSCLGDTAVYLFGATNEIGRVTKAGYWIQWQAILAAQEQGCRWYDLGGVDPETNPGGFRFKSRMGGTDVTAPGPFCLQGSGVLGMVIERALWWKYRKAAS